MSLSTTTSIINLTHKFFSYICDEFVLNDTAENHIDQIRNILIRHPTKGDDIYRSILRDGCGDEENGEISSTSNEKDSASANGESDKHSDKQSDRHCRLSHNSEQDQKEEHGGRQLRPRRKRYALHRGMLNLSFM